MTDFYWECARASWELLKAIGTGLKLKDPEYLLRSHSGHNNQLRLLHYPPIPARELENQISARMPAHSDWGSFTLLFQDECGGLEVEDQQRPGEFIKVLPLKNAIMTNIGDLLMRWSNGINPPFFLPSSRKKRYVKAFTLVYCTYLYCSRLSEVNTSPRHSPSCRGSFHGPRADYSSSILIPYFVSPDVDSVIECLAECADAENPIKYEPVVQREYRLMRAKLQYPEKAVV